MIMNTERYIPRRAVGNNNPKDSTDCPEINQNFNWCGGWDLNPRRPTPVGPEPTSLDQIPDNKLFSDTPARYAVSFNLSKGF